MNQKRHEHEHEHPKDISRKVLGRELEKSWLRTRVPTDRSEKLCPALGDR